MECECSIIRSQINWTNATFTLNHLKYSIELLFSKIIAILKGAAEFFACLMISLHMVKYMIWFFIQLRVYPILWFLIFLIQICDWFLLWLKDVTWGQSHFSKSCFSLLLQKPRSSIRMTITFIPWIGSNQ